MAGQAGLTLQQQEHILNSLHPELLRLNLEEIVPHLNQQGLLSSSEKEKLNNKYFTTRDKIDELLKWIPTKGSDALARFIECLRNSADGTGHDELATLLEDKIRDHEAELVNSSRDLTFLLRRTIWYSVLGATVLVLLSVVLHIPNIHHRRVWVDYSSTLPDYVTHFLGRDKEINDLVKLLDSENTDVRTVSIVGPPGFGKSSLAIHVGHEMIDRGVVVKYVNLDEVAIDDIPEKILGNAGSITKGNSIDRLMKWAKDDVKYPVVIILDNCDVTLHEERDDFQKFLQLVRKSATTVMIKFLLTTKHRINLLDEFEEYSLKEISFDASCNLLHRVTKLEIDEQTCRGITKLTGNVPLALKVVGAILRKRTRGITEIISNLERELLETLNPSDLDQKVNASLVLSYYYLNERQKRLGHYLALFPGSFTVLDACIILEDILDSDCKLITAEVEELDQRSLLQFLGKSRYQFHKITKEFFFASKPTHEEKFISAFLTGFLVRYGNKLYHLSMIYENDSLAALHTLGVEKHNFQYLLDHSEEICLMDIEHSLSIFETLQVALKTRFLTSEFALMDLKKPFTDICRCLLGIIPTITSEEELGLARSIIDLKQAEMVMRIIQVLIRVAVELHDFNFHDITLLEEVKVQLDILRNVIDVPEATEFYYVLGSHYHALGELEKEKRCHEKILQRTNAQLYNCVPGSCNYNSIAKAHYHLENYEFGARFLEMDLKHNEKRMSKFVLVSALELLHACQSKVKNHTMAKATLERILPVLPSLLGANIKDIYSNLEILSSVTLLLRTKGKTKEATKLEKKQLMAIKIMNTTKTRFDESFAIKASVLATNLFEAGQYGEVPEVAECALQLLKKRKKYIKIIELELILGKAEYNNGKRSASIKSLKYVAGTVVYYHPLYHEMGKEACRYMLAQSHLEVSCLLITWIDWKTIGYSVLGFIVSDTVVFPTYFAKEHYKTLSSDIAPRSSYLDIFPFEYMSYFSKIIHFVVQTGMLIFLHLFSVFHIFLRFILLVVNFVLMFTKLFLLCVFLYRMYCSLRFLLRLIYIISRACFQ